MKTEVLSQVADWLEEHSTAVADREVQLDCNSIYAALNQLQVLKRPLTEYWKMTEANYDQTESDHRLTLQNDQQALEELADRVLVNHVDGSLAPVQLNFSYNHENPFVDGEYLVTTDLHVVEYALSVLGAVAANTDGTVIAQTLSADAVLSIGLAVHAIEAWQQD
ncbi:hypothetical protein HU830_04410 [Lactobacillus sp. DCY120]|uniref:Uncharacterized protein n=1 Tax=Bombilactobacillus apium TaxID=2675299 RepID=A0A850QX74_9LACO|nr:hypothetical protein [Bombilactobacillus apium]NVY96414.1 hypothetical protein [Bombilactobacillus apium]